MTPMKEYRIGTDIKVRWRVTINEGTVPVEGADLTLQLVNPLGQRMRTPFAVVDGKVVAIVYGKDQTMLGAYAFTLWLNYGKVNQTAIDHVDAFRLVASSNLIEGEDDSDNLQTGATVDLSGVMTVGVQGASAYETWLRNGHSGTEGDFLAWLKGPQGDPGAPGEPGPAGNGIDHIALTGTSSDGKRDMYTIFFTNGNNFNFYVNHGKDATIDAYTKEQINALLDKKVDSSRKVNGKTLDADISISGKDIPYGSGSDSIYQTFEDLFASLRDNFGDIESRFENLPSGSPEVHIGTDAPTGGEVLWIDPSEEVIVQTTGTATDKVMSQKAVSDLIGNVESLLSSI